MSDFVFCTTRSGRKIHGGPMHSSTTYCGLWLRTNCGNLAVHGEPSAEALCWSCFGAPGSEQRARFVKADELERAELEHFESMAYGYEPPERGAPLRESTPAEIDAELERRAAHYQEQARLAGLSEPTSELLGRADALIEYYSGNDAAARLVAQDRHRGHDFECEQAPVEPVLADMLANIDAEHPGGLVRWQRFAMGLVSHPDRPASFGPGRMAR